MSDAIYGGHVKKPPFPKKPKRFIAKKEPPLRKLLLQQQLNEKAYSEAELKNLLKFNEKYVLKINNNLYNIKEFMKVFELKDEPVDKIPFFGLIRNLSNLNTDDIPIKFRGYNVYRFNVLQAHLKQIKRNKRFSKRNRRTI